MSLDAKMLEILPVEERKGAVHIIDKGTQS